MDELQKQRFRLSNRGRCFFYSREATSQADMFLYVHLAALHYCGHPVRAWTAALLLYRDNG